MVPRQTDTPKLKQPGVLTTQKRALTVPVLVKSTIAKYPVPEARR
jgi:hypothetical protein